MKITNKSKTLIWVATKIGEYTSSSYPLRPGQSTEISREYEEIIVE